MTYTEGTCSNVYCHSRQESFTTGAVPEPGIDFPFPGDYPIVYPPLPLSFARTYAEPSWAGSLSCDGCHGMPPRTFSDATEAGAGDSHSWIDGDGHENLHGWSHGFTPPPCAACHYDTVRDPGQRWRDTTAASEGWSIYVDVPLWAHARHVDGDADVAFSPDPIPVGSDYDLSGATYATDTRTCSNVSCHLEETEVVWGTPFRWRNGWECNVCHRM